MKKKRKLQMKPRTKLILLLVQMLVLVSILLGVTYAINGDPKTPTPTSNRIQRQVRVSDFDLPVGNWQEGESIEAKIFVENNTPSQAETGDPNADSGAVCVRVSLKEFLEVMGAEGPTITDSVGNPILFATVGEGVRTGEYITLAEAKTLGLIYYGSYVVDEVEYATTNNDELRHGIIGKPMNRPGTLQKQWGDVPRASIRHGNQANSTPLGGGLPECAYQPYLWDDKGISRTLPSADLADTIRNYIALGGTDEIRFLSEWYAEGGELGDFWLIDDTTNDGWVYWANRLAPQKKTSDLLDKLTLTNHPVENEGVFRHSMHLDLQATDYTENEVVGAFGDVDDPEVNTLDKLEGNVTEEKFDLIEKLIKGHYQVKFLPNLPEGVDPAKLTGMPTPNPQWVAEGNLLAKPANPTVSDSDYRFIFWSEKADASTATLTDRFDFTQPITQDVKLYAVWQIPFRFKLKVDDEIPTTSTDHPDQGALRQVTLNIPSSGGNDFIIDWGAAGTPVLTAGVTENLGNTQVRYTGYVAENQVRYQYDDSVTGEVIIEITGTMPGSMKFNYVHSDIRGDTRLTEMLTPMLPSTQTTFDSTFRDCSNLTTIPADLFANNPQVTSFYGAFMNCTSLEAIPAGLFDQNKNVVFMWSTFVSCTSLTTIPEDLFKENTEVTTFQFMFGHCTSLEAIPEGLFDYNPLVNNFAGTFYNCKKLTSVPLTLFDKNKNGALNQIAPLGVGNKAKINFYLTFYGCTGLNGTVGDKAPAIWTTHDHLWTGQWNGDYTECPDPRAYLSTLITSATGFVHNDSGDIARIWN